MRKLRGMVSTEAIQEARRILGSVRKLRLSDEPRMDIVDRLGLLTLAAGLRDVAAFGFAERNNEAKLAAVQKVLTAQGLRCLMTPQVRHVSKERLRDAIGDLFRVFDRLDAESYSQHTGKLLWAFREARQEEQIRSAVEGRIDSGLVLGYPRCCVEFHDLGQARFDRAFATATIDAVGTDPTAVERALREDLEVELEGDPGDMRNIGRSEERFPFVQHIACDECLSSEDSPTAVLNRAYSELARQFDQRFHRLSGEMVNVEVRIDRLLEEAEKKGNRPGKLAEPFRTQLESLFEERDRLYSRILEA